MCYFIFAEIVSMADGLIREMGIEIVNRKVERRFE